LPESSSSAKPRKTRLTLPPVAIVILAGAAIALAGAWYLSRPAASRAPAPLSGDARAYVHNLRLGGVDMQKHESYLGQGLVEITGSIGNAGDRQLDAVEINLVFYDPYGQVVLRERRAIVDRKMKGLRTGETKPFRLAFDNIPDGWNQALPQLVIAAIDFSR
jgi:hypothetical protein